MANVSMESIKKLWDETSEHNWAALRDTLQQSRKEEEAERGIKDDLVDRMIQITRDLEKSGPAYPDSPVELYRTFNDRID